MHALKYLVLILFLLCPVSVYAEDLYLALTDTGAANGTSCANARIYTWFNSAANWGGGAGEIDPGDTVHVCGVWTGGNATSFLQFQADGTVGNVVTILFETGAEMRPNYCASAGCIDLNGKSYILINGGSTCGNDGSATGWTLTACNGKIQNFAIGSITQTCPNASTCVAFSGNTTGIGSGTGNPHHVEVKNMHLGPFYTRDAADTTAGGTGTHGFGVFGGALPHHITFHHSVCRSVMHCNILSMGALSADLAVYSMYNVDSADQCHAQAIGGDGGNNYNITTLLFHNNKITDWNKWAASNGACHTNGFIWFNGNNSAIHTPNGFIGTSDTKIYNNYFEGDLSGGIVGSSPSGFMNCADNCDNIYEFNNVLVSTCTGSSPTRTCGTPIYFNGPGGGRQHAYNNTIIGAVGGVSANITYYIGETGNPILKNNVAYQMTQAFSNPYNNQQVTSDYNVFQVTTSAWSCWNTLISGNCVSLAQWQAGPYLQDIHSLNTDPLLTGTYELTSNSPAKDAGVNLSAGAPAELLYDAKGLSRPQGSAWDMGAYEFDQGGAGQSPNPPGASYTSGNRASTGIRPLAHAGQRPVR